MAMISSYGKVWQLGHKETLRLFDAPVVVQEKVDGSQFSFAWVGDCLHGKSKNVRAPLADFLNNSMFAAAAQHLLDNAEAIPRNITFRGEVLAQPKHNTLKYDTVPAGHIVLFDADPCVAPPREVYESHARNMGVDVVPQFYNSAITSSDDLAALLEVESFLGGTRIEGVVVKRYDAYDSFGYLLKGKIVAEEFREAHRVDWKERNPSGKDFAARLASMYGSQARWMKAVQHLREQGVLEGDPRDIGKLIPEIIRDIHEEAADEIKDALYAHWKGGAGRKVVSGFPEFYKQLLLDEALDASRV